MNLENVNVEKGLKIIFMGTPEFSVPILEGLIEHYKIRAIVTQPDRPVGRDGHMSYPPVKEVGMKHTILVIQPNKMKEDWEQVAELEPDLIITCAYGQILPKALLEVPRLGCINVHASLLPKLRGGAPIHRAILAGYKKTGVTIMYMNSKMDEGDIISQREIEITDTDTASSLHDKLSLLGRDLLLDTLPSIIDGTATRTPQNHSEATYGLNIKREDEKIDFEKTRKEIYNQVRGLYSWPGSYCMFEGKILKVWKCRINDNYFPELFNGQITTIYEDGFGVKVSNGELVFQEVQPEGKTKMSGVSFANGIASHSKFIGKILS